MMLGLDRELRGPASCQGLAGDLPTPTASGSAVLSAFVSIVIPCRNEALYIAPLLDSILASTYPRDRLEVLVVDGMSDDGTRAVIAGYAARHPVVRLLDNPKRTTPCALNLGISRARGTVIMRMDAHAYYPPNYIADLVRWLERTGADHVGGVRVVLPADATATARGIATVLTHRFGIGDAPYRHLGVEEPQKHDVVPLGCFRREVFQRVGLFDEDLVRNQDDEFDFRLTRAGGTMMVVPGVVSYYYARRSLRQLARMYYQYGYFKPLVTRKTGRPTTLRQLGPPLFVLGVIATGLLAPWVVVARAAFVLLLGAYIGTNIACSSVVLFRHGVAVGLAATAAFAVMHVCYGLGFLGGVLDFLVLRKPGGAPVPLSR